MYCLLILIAICLFSFPASAALPPIPVERLSSQASTILVGKVKAITCEENFIKPDETDHYCVADITVEKIEKSSSTNEFLNEPLNQHKKLEVNSVVSIYYYKTGKRPEGWVGPQRQNSYLLKDERVRLYLEGTQDDVYGVIEPNGIEKL